MDKDFQQHVKKMDSQYQQELRDDYGRETSGQGGSGRIRRFVKGDDIRFNAKEEDKRKTLSTLQTLLLNDPEYRAAYEGAMGALNDAETAVYDALQESSEAVANARADLNNMLSQAQAFKEGTKIFLSEDGNIYTEHGRKLSDRETASIEINDKAPTWEVYQAKKKALADAEARHTQLLAYETELGDMRHRVEDEDHPVSKEELESIQGR